jgi:hypothetical protein
MIFDNERIKKLVVGTFPQQAFGISAASNAPESGRDAFDHRSV